MILTLSTPRAFFSAVMKRSRDDFVMGIPLKITNHTEDSPTDGIVSVESSKFGNYRKFAFFEFSVVSESLKRLIESIRNRIDFNLFGKILIGLIGAAN